MSLASNGEQLASKSIFSFALNVADLASTQRLKRL